MDDWWLGGTAALAQQSSQLGACHVDPLGDTLMTCMRDHSLNADCAGAVRCNWMMRVSDTCSFCGQTAVKADVRWYAWYFCMLDDSLHVTYKSNPPLSLLPDYARRLPHRRGRDR